MKKILSILAILTCCLFSVNVNAENISLPEFYENDDTVTSDFRNALSNIEFWSGFFSAQGFNESEEINPELIVQMITYDTQKYFEEYIIDGEENFDEDGNSWYSDPKFLIPADVFEECIKRKFRITDDGIKKIRNIFKNNESLFMNNEKDYKNVDGEYYYEYRTTNGWGFGDEGNFNRWLGYKYLGNNQYEIFSQELTLNDCEIIENESHCNNYVPSDSDILGIDYIIADIETWNNELEDFEIKETPVKIVAYVKAKVTYDGEFVKFLSYSPVVSENIPDESTLVKEDKMKEINVKNESISINAPEGNFIEGTKITVEEQTKGEIFDKASKALKEKAGAFVIYEINAKAGEYDIEPNGKVEISIKVPAGYKNPVIYYVTEDGKLEKLETKVKDGYATAYTTHFSTYAIVDEKVTVIEKIEQAVDKATDKVVEKVVESPGTGIAGGVGIVALAGGCGTYFYKKSKKNNRFPKSK